MGVWIIRWAFVAVGITWFGCGDDGHVLIDTGVVDGSDTGLPDAAVAVAPPDIPWLEEGVPPIMLAPCPEGWREVTGRDVTECDPYPEGGAATCGAGEAHFPGEAGCRSVGDPCPGGDYAATLPSDGPIVYVKAGAAPGGDGALASPFAALDEVSWVELASGTTVALAKGTYDGVIELGIGTHIVGACVEETVLTGIDELSEATAAVVVSSPGAEASMRNVTIADAPRWGVRVNGAELNLTGVVIERSAGLGLYASGAGAAVTLDTVVVRDTQPRPSDGELGRGIQAAGGAQVNGAHLILSGNRDIGLLAIDPGTVMTLVDSIVQETQPSVAGPGGLGVYVGSGGRLDASRFVVSENHQTGIYAREDGTSLTLVDAIVRDTRSRTDLNEAGFGILLQTGARLEGTRLLVAGNRAHGLYIHNRLTKATLVDVVIRDTATDESVGDLGHGITLFERGHLEATRLLVTDNHETGILAIDAMTEVVLNDTVVRNTLPNAIDDGGGRAIELYHGSRLEGARLLLANNRDIGLFVATAGTEAILADVVIQDMSPRASDGSFGRGIQLQGTALLQGSRMRIERTFEAAFLAGDQAVAELEDVSIAQVMESECTSDGCLGDGIGHALAAIASNVELTRFELQGAAVCGVFVASDPADPLLLTSVDLQAGIVTQSGFGACLLVDGYDVGRLTDDVVYRDNGAETNPMALPVPASVEVPPSE